jgi:hypothetical protein
VTGEAPGAVELDDALAAVAPADVVVGLLTYDNVETLGSVLTAVRAGVAKYCPGLRVVLVVSDGGSTDGTAALLAPTEDGLPRVVATHATPAAERVAVPYHGVPGRRAGQRTVLGAASRLGARCCVLVGSGSLTIGPDWVDRLARPVLESGYDYVAPAYARHRYDGTLTRGLIGPLVRALYGIRLSHLLGEEAGLSARLVSRLMETAIWEGDASRQGIDLWLAVMAASDGFTVCESWLGTAAVDSRGRPGDLATIFAQAVGGTFALLEATPDLWTESRGSAPVPLIGTREPDDASPRDLDAVRMIRAFRLGLKDLLGLWEQVMEPTTLGEVIALEAAPDDAFRFPHALWARVIYDFALGYRFRVLHRDHLLRSLVPLYLGRTGAFIQATLPRATAADAWLESGAVAFEREKPYLLERWR